MEHSPEGAPAPAPLPPYPTPGPSPHPEAGDSDTLPNCPGDPQGDVLPIGAFRGARAKPRGGGRGPSSGPHLQAVIPRVHRADLHSMQLLQRQLPRVQVRHDAVRALGQVRAQVVGLREAQAAQAQAQHPIQSVLQRPEAPVHEAPGEAQQSVEAHLHLQGSAGSRAQVRVASRTRPPVSSRVLTSTEKRMGMRPKSCPGFAAYSMAWHEWLQPGPRRIASTRLICFSSGTAAADILALPTATRAPPLRACAGPPPPRPSNPRTAPPLGPAPPPIADAHQGRARHGSPTLRCGAEGAGTKGMAAGAPAVTQ